MARTRGKSGGTGKAAPPAAATHTSAPAKPAAAAQPKRAVATPTPAATAAARVAAAATTKITLSGIAIKTVLTNLAGLIGNLILANQPSVPLPSAILGTLQQPDGTPGAFLEIEVLPPPSAPGTSVKPSPFGITTSGSQVIATGLTDGQGNFSIDLPAGVVLPPGVSLSFRVRGSVPTVVVAMTVAPNLLGPAGYLGTMSLSQQLSPIPPAIYALLQQGLNRDGGPDGTANGSAPPALPKLTLGDDADCIRVLENQVSFEQFPYGIFFQLIAPALYTETEAVDPNQAGVYQGVTRTDTPLNRAQLTGPISIDEFRLGLLTGPAIVGSLGLGYVLRCSQSWQFQGLALGDLVYSLPLAPGEQQQVVVEEQTTTLAVRDTEAVFGSETSFATQTSDSSTQAVFNSAFDQTAQGGSSFNTASQTGSISADLCRATVDDAAPRATDRHADGDVFRINLGHDQDDHQSQQAARADHA